MIRMIRPLKSLGLIALSLTLAAPALAEPRANQLFGARATPSPHLPQAIGSYAAGCAAGLVELPETGPTWQAMRLSRNRNWGHPDAIAFVERLSRFAATQPGWSGLYVGDISQPRGGPMVSGHQSHQIGLDIDIWMLPAQSLRLTRAQRESLSSLDVRSADQRSVNRNWTPQHAEIIKRAAQDPGVDRVFVTPPVKIEFCKTATRRDRDWMQKIRPIQGHNYHFHVRLKCPPGDRGCVTQTPSVAELSKGGNGCDDTLRWWVTDYLNPPRARPGDPPPQPAPPRRNVRDFTMTDLPQACQTVLSAR